MSLLKVNEVTDLGGDAPTIPPYAGQILQVVSTNKTDTFSTTSTTFVDVTGASATITPVSTSSKLLISYSLSVANSNVEGVTHLVLTDGSNNVLLAGDASSSRPATLNSFWSGNLTNGSRLRAVFAGSFLYSPNTASAFTVKARLRIGSLVAQTAFVGRDSVDNDNDAHGRTPLMLTLMEVAG